MGWKVCAGLLTFFRFFWIRPVQVLRWLTGRDAVELGIELLWSGAVVIAGAKCCDVYDAVHRADWLCVAGNLLFVYGLFTTGVPDWVKGLRRLESWTGDTVPVELVLFSVWLVGMSVFGFSALLALLAGLPRDEFCEHVGFCLLVSGLWSASLDGGPKRPAFARAAGWVRDRLSSRAPAWGGA